MLNKFVIIQGEEDGPVLMAGDQPVRFCSSNAAHKYASDLVAASPGLIIYVAKVAIVGVLS